MMGQAAELGDPGACATLALLYGGGDTGGRLLSCVVPEAEGARAQPEAVTAMRYQVAAAKLGQVMHACNAVRCCLPACRPACRRHR